MPDPACGNLKTLPLSLRGLMQRLSLPSNLFSGLRIAHSLAPDNIICFQRDHPKALKSHGVSSNYHHRFELVFVFESNGCFRVDRSSYRLEPGECALIFPNQFHQLMEPSGGPSTWLSITFELRDEEQIRGLRDAPRVLDEIALDYLGELLTEYVSPRRKIPDSLAISFYLSRLLFHLLDSQEIPFARRDIHSSDDVRDLILEGINRYVRSHLSQSTTIADLSKELGYSVSHLRAVFRDRLQVSLGRYMRESRLSEAAQLLQNSDLNISEIGLRCGFDSLFAFSRAFRKTYGIPPRSYRNLVKVAE